jgi:predicted Zn finger-like uncharacterized protein
MDVRCEQCKTLYELDEARVSEAGTAVRCTTCGHVFRVRKSVLLVTESGEPTDASSAAPPPVAEKPQWRVRSPTGKVVAFRELTSLQKWIVERKFGRDDEISLRGDSWRRLGDIAELQPFFALLDEVDRVRDLEARLRQAELPAEAPPLLETELTGHDPATAITDPRRPVATLGPEPETEPPVRASTPMAYTMSDAPAPQQTPPPGMDPGLGLSPGLMDDTWDTKPPRSKTPWIVALGVLAAGAAAAAYVYVWLPSQDQQRRGETDQARAAADNQEMDRQQAALRERERKAKEELVADLSDAGASPDAGVPASGPPPRGAGNAAPAPAAADGTASAQAAQQAGSQPRGHATSEARPRTYEEWMSRGDVDRANERYQAALDDYDQALALDSSQPEAHLARGRTLLGMGNAEAAAAAFQRALDLNPRYSVAAFWLGEAQRRTGRRADAIKAYEEYLQAAPDGNYAASARQALQTLRQE